MSAGHDDIDNAAIGRDLLAAIGEAAAPRPLGKNTRERLFDRITASLDGPEGTVTLRQDEGTWSSLMDKVQVKVLRTDTQAKNRTILLKLEPGAVLPRHSHRQEEECLVLSGRICFGDFCLGPGDYHVARAGYEHDKLHAPDGALLLLRQELHESVGLAPG